MAMNTTYTTYKFRAAGNIYSCLVVAGLVNYVSILKESNNPFKTLGRDFLSFDEAQRYYKLPEIKTSLLLIEAGVLQPDKAFTV